MKNWLGFWLIVIASTVQALPEPGDYVVTLVRHGDRSPRFPLNREDWPMGVGEMTPRGFQQCFAAGEKFRTDELPKNFPKQWKQGLSFHQARGLDRTIQCATTMLQAIYPDETVSSGKARITTIPPVYAALAEKDPILGTPNNCPAYYELIKEFGEGPGGQQQRKELTEEKIKVWSAKSGMDTSLHSMLRLSDTLLIRKLHNLPRPDFISAEDQKKLFDLTDWHFGEIGRNREMTEVATYHLLGEIQNRLQRHQNCKSSSQQPCEYFYLLAVSDINLITLLSALGLPQNENTPYASALTLRFKENKRMIVTWKGQEQSLPGCGHQCTLEHWNQIVSSVQAFDWHAKCGLKGH